MEKQDDRVLRSDVGRGDLVRGRSQVILHAYEGDEGDEVNRMVCIHNAGGMSIGQAPFVVIHNAVFDTSNPDVVVGTYEGHINEPNTANLGIDLIKATSYKLEYDNGQWIATLRNGQVENRFWDARSALRLYAFRDTDGSYALYVDGPS